MNPPFSIAITTGDLDGIGLEVASKALSAVGPKSDFRYVLFRSRQAPESEMAGLDKKFQRKTFSDIHTALKHPLTSKNQIYDIASPLPPPVWVETAGQLCMTKTFHAMVTGPLSKTTISQSGMKDMGHTGILKRVAGQASVFMGFWGAKFSVVLATDHLPVRQVSSELTKERLRACLLASQDLEPLLKKSLLKKPIGLLGLNPHAGEEGMLGEEENLIHRPLMRELKDKVPIEGPLVPDAAFHAAHWARYRYFVASYHDQGLIPFKMIHGHEGGVHLTLGLPFLRTSVDHGTAKDIFGRGLADPASMTAALKTALLLVKHKQKARL